MEPKPKRPVLFDPEALMESPLFWTMSVEDRLALIRNKASARDDGIAALRQRIQAWIKTGI
ncbi:MAG: hypothetical protein ACLQUW_10875 [Desulfobaccales bacterium]